MPPKYLYFKSLFTCVLQVMWNDDRMKKNLLLPLGVIAVAGLALLPSCSYTAPWRRIVTDLALLPPESIVAVTYARTRPGKRVQFFRSVTAILEDLPRHEGLLGYSFRFQVFGREAWTVTAWKDESSLRQFSRSALHAQAVADGEAVVEDFQFGRLNRPTASLPVRWSDAIDTLSPYSQKPSP
jgi:heme-degrading monooxygenase HmoA